jgi:threonine dehydrogenase-like Zn-dependent dehydrogenase
MRAALFVEPRRIDVGDRPDPSIAQPTDAVVRVVLTCVCGSDLWYYRGDSPFEPGPIGHEFVGVVEDVGADVRDVRKGDFVIAPFAFSDGTCPTVATASPAPAPRAASTRPTATAGRARRSGYRSPTARW